MQRGTFREIDPVTDNPDAEPVAPCAFAKPAIIVHGRRSGQMLTVCTDDHCPIHDPRATARQAAEPAPEMTPSPEEETEEEAEQRKAEHEQRRKEYEAEQERRAEERRLEEEREQQENEAEQARREEVRKEREATFERLVANAPKSFTAAQLRVLLRALVNLDPYTFTNDVVEDLPEEFQGRDSEEVLMAALEATADDKLTGFAVRFALAAHRGIPRQDEPDFLAEAEAAFTPVPKPERKTKQPKVTKPTLVLAKKKKGAAKQAAA